MSANFTPSQSAIKDLKPFRFWCQKVLPTVYDDSLSYYELLTKVVNYLNDTIDNVEALNDNVQNIYDAYILLQNYVNEYFDQNFPQLVSDKLDAMAEDGTLTALISGYIDPLFEAKTDEIDEIIEQQNSTINSAITEQNNTISEAIEEQDNDISLLQTRMNNFINNHAGLVGEETIWEGSTPFVTENTSIALDNPVSEYAFIDVYYNHRGKRAVQRFQTADVLDASGFYVRDAETQRAPGGTPQLYPYFRILQFKLVHSTNNGSVLTLAESSESVWDGDVTSYPATEISPSTSGITKIVGVNMVQSDSEVADARVGGDGTVYPNLEARLNAEFSALKSDIDDMSGVPSNVKMALFTLLHNTGYKPGVDLTNEMATIEAWATVVTSLTLSASSLNVNGTTPQTITAYVVPSTATVVWSSSNEAVATVVGGVVTGVNNGTCTITATAGDLTATCMITVTGFSTVTGITAVYTQSGTVYPSDSLDSLRDDLVVTATYSDSTTEVITAYALSGTLEVGTSTIAVTYSGVGTTFSVTVSEEPLYAFTNGTYNASNIATVEITNRNHIKVTMLTNHSTPAYGSFLNLKDVAFGDSSVVNNLTSWFTIPANKVATLTLSNVINSASRDFQMNFRKANATQSASFGIAGGTHTAGEVVTNTLATSEDVSCLFMYFARDLTLTAGDVFEFDVTFTVDGERYI